MVNEPARRMRILLVDDDSYLRLTVMERLCNQGFDVTEAASADEALRSVDKLGDRSAPFDLLITDIEMPGSLDGISLARRMKAVSPRTLIIFMSGSGPREEISELGTFLPKPFRLRDLLGLVDKI